MLHAVYCRYAIPTFYQSSLNAEERTVLPSQTGALLSAPLGAGESTPSLAWVVK